MRVAGFRRRLTTSAMLVALFAGTAVLASASPAFAVCADDAREDDDSAEQATRLADPDGQIGQMCADDADWVYNETTSWTSVDWYSWTARAGEELVAELLFAGNEGDLDLVLLNEAGSVVASAATLDAPEVMTFPVEAPGTYYVLVLGYDSVEIGYNLQFHTETGGGGSGGGSSALQQTSVNAVATNGLSVTVQNPNVFFGDLQAGAANMVSVGDIYYLNTLGNGQPWSATVAATSLVNGGSHIPFSNMSFVPGSTVTPAGPQAGGGGQFTGSDQTPGQSYSDPVTVVTGAGMDQGSFSQSDSSASLLMPQDVQTGAYSGTFQYTITG